MLFLGFQKPLERVVNPKGQREHFDMKNKYSEFLKALIFFLKHNKRQKIAQSLKI